MSDQQIGKKELETEEFIPFLEAYEFATEERLTLLCGGESPDFICLRPDKSEIGIELAKVMRDPEDSFWDRILEKKMEIDPYEAQEQIHRLIQKKEKVRQDRYVKNVKETILVFQLVDGSLDSLRYVIESLNGDFDDHGFFEVWLTDYSGHDAYGDVELFGLFPSTRWGYYQRPNPGRKPYG